MYLVLWEMFLLWQNEIEPCELLLCPLGAFSWHYTLIFLVLNFQCRHDLIPLRCQGAEGLNLGLSAPHFLWGIYLLTPDSERLWENLLVLFWFFSFLVFELFFNYSASSQSRISLDEVRRIKDCLKRNCTGTCFICTQSNTAMWFPVQQQKYVVEMGNVEIHRHVVVFAQGLTLVLELHIKGNVYCKVLPLWITPICVSCSDLIKYCLPLIKMRY